MLNRRIAFITLIFFLSPSCKTTRTTTDSQSKTIFGEDDRANWDAHGSEGVFPYSSVGSLNGTCTAFLVSKQLVMTAAHCVLPERENMTYQEHNASRDKPLVPVRVLAVGTNDPKDTGANDWAILQLATPSVQQPFPIGSTTYINPLNQNAWIVGYSYDLDGLSVANNCTIKSIDQGELSHDCDLRPGASGGPLYIRGANDLRILVGIQSGGMDGKADTYSTPERNNAAGVDGFIDRLAELVALYP